MVRNKLRRFLPVPLLLSVLMLVPPKAYSANLKITDLFTTTGNWSVMGTLSATLFSGDGSGLTNVTASGLACTGCVSAGQTNATEVQRRVTGTCGAGQFVQVVNQDGTVTCGSGGSSGGTVTQINSGDGLTGGPITGSGTLSANFAGTGSATTVARSDHNHDAVYQKKYAKVIVVAKSGGDFTDPGAAADSIADASATNPYLIKVMPGIYNVYAVVLKEYVDIEGSGEKVTKITATNPSAGFGTLIAMGNNEIRSLTVEELNTFFTDKPSGIYVASYTGNVKITDTTVNATGVETAGINAQNTVDVNNVTINVTVYSSYHNSVKGITFRTGGNKVSNTTINVTGTSSEDAKGYGIYSEVNSGTDLFQDVIVNAIGSYKHAVLSYNNTAKVTQISNSVLNGNVAIGQNGGTIKIDSSVINGAVMNDPYDPFGSPYGTIKIGNSKITNGISSSSGNIKLFNCYDGNYDPIANGTY